MSFFIIIITIDNTSLSHNLEKYRLQLVQECAPPDFGVCGFGLSAGVFPAFFAGWGVSTWAAPCFPSAQTVEEINQQNLIMDELQEIYTKRSSAESIK